MRSKKAGKRLDKVETLLSKVIAKYATREPDMVSLLDSAKESVVRVKAVLNDAAPRNGRKPLEKAKIAKRQPTTNGIKKASATAPAERKTA